MKTYVVDTHALVWYLTGDRRLGPQAEAVLNDPDVTLIIPAIVLAEIKDLAHKERFAQTLDDVLASAPTWCRWSGSPWLGSFCSPVLMQFTRRLAPADPLHLRLKAGRQSTRPKAPLSTRVKREPSCSVSVYSREAMVASGVSPWGEMSC